MSEKRKPVATWTIRKGCNRSGIKLELFRASEWPDKDFVDWHGKYVRGSKWIRFRVRYDGKWWKDKKGRDIALTKSEFRDVLFRLTKGYW